MTWNEKLEQLIVAAGSLRELARRMQLADPAKISRWRLYGLLPAPSDQIKLAMATHTSLEEIRRLVWEAEAERELARERRFRPTTGARRLVSLPQKSAAAPRPSRRKRARNNLGAWALAVASAAALASPTPVVAASPITNHTQTTSESRDSVASKRRTREAA